MKPTLSPIQNYYTSKPRFVGFGGFLSRLLFSYHLLLLEAPIAEMERGSIKASDAAGFDSLQVLKFNQKFI